MDDITKLVQEFKQEVREKAIDEFVEAFMEADITKEVHEKLFDTVHFTKDVRRTVGVIDMKYNDLVKKIAEQLKGGE